MRIRKTTQTTTTSAQVVNNKSASQNNTYSCNYINNMNTYSTTETVVGTWADGKPIYRKTYNFTATSSTNTFSLSLSNIDNIWISDKSFIIEIASEAGRKYFYPLNGNYNPSGDWIFVRIKNDNNSPSLEIKADSQDRIADIHATFEYTKTSD